MGSLVHASHWNCEMTDGLGIPSYVPKGQHKSTTEITPSAKNATTPISIADPSFEINGARALQRLVLIPLDHIGMMLRLIGFDRKRPRVLTGA